VENGGSLQQSFEPSDHLPVSACYAAATVTRALQRRVALCKIDDITATVGGDFCNFPKTEGF
jgi:hypothetical protein